MTYEEFIKSFDEMIGFISKIPCVVDNAISIMLTSDKLFTQVKVVRYFDDGSQELINTTVYEQINPIFLAMLLCFFKNGLYHEFDFGRITNGYMNPQLETFSSYEGTVSMYDLVDFHINTTNENITLLPFHLTLLAYHLGLKYDIESNAYLDYEMLVDKDLTSRKSEEIIQILEDFNPDIHKISFEYLRKVYELKMALDVTDMDLKSINPAEGIVIQFPGLKDSNK